MSKLLSMILTIGGVSVAVVFAVALVWIEIFARPPEGTESEALFGGGSFDFLKLAENLFDVAPKHQRTDQQLLALERPRRRRVVPAHASRSTPWKSRTARIWPFLTRSPGPTIGR